MSLADYQAHLRHMIRRLVCSDAESLAFLGLGGQVQLIYKTEDEFIVADQTVASCPSQKHRQRLARTSTLGGFK
jgi:hypothetical protein